MKRVDMKPLNLSEVEEYVNTHIVDFHARKIKSLEELTLKRLLSKNPYLFKAKNIIGAYDLISNLLDAFLSSSEEKLFGDFLEGLAIFVAGSTCNGHKSSAQGVDLEFFNKDIHYIVSVKSGTNWGNSSQQKKLEQDLKEAEKRLKQSQFGKNIQPVLGICYGKTHSSFIRGYLKVVGQNFWYLISENKDLYKEIIAPIGYRAEEHNKMFYEEKIILTNRLANLFSLEFCNKRGNILWDKLIEYNSGNFDLDQILSD